MIFLDVITKLPFGFYCTAPVCVFQRWTGSNTNPNNNDGQGRPGTDRSNIALLESQSYEEGSLAYYSPYTKNGHLGRNYPRNLDEATFLGFSREELQDLAVLGTRK